MATDRSRVRGLILSALALALVIVPLFYWRLDFLHGATDATGRAARLLFFERFYLDFVLFLLVGIFLVNGPWWLRIFGYAWWLQFVAGYALQWMSVRIGGEFVSILAVDNINHLSLLVNLGSITGVIVIAAVVLGGIWFIECLHRARLSWRPLIATAMVLLGLGLAVQFHAAWVPARVLAATEELDGHQDNRMGRRSPIESFYRVLFDDPTEDACLIGPAELAAADRYGISLALRERYPLTRDEIYRSEPPYQPESPTDQPNVIVLFAEGISARTLDAYDAMAPGLTPNIDDFSRHAMRVDNYYNHTYATYRGLHGQLCSLFPTRGGTGGWQTHFGDIRTTGYLCLNHMFSEAGYHTAFLDTHRRDAAYVDEMMEMLGFDRVYTAEDVMPLYIEGEPLRPDAMSDNQLFDGLVAMLEEGAFSSGDDPFFLALYNLETHAWQDVAVDGARFDDGGHPILNAIHNYDRAFGRFWGWFRESDYFDNTVVILTADHAHYPDAGFVGLMEGQEDYRPFFVDRIPFMVYRPGGGLPQSYDAARATSLDFAPSIAHLLGLENRANPFLGRSIFEPESLSRPGGLAAAGDRFYLVDREGLHPYRWEEEQVPEEAEAVSCVIRTTRQLEAHDRIWPRNED